jgi:hypothetical protein
MISTQVVPPHAASAIRQRAVKPAIC